MSALPLCFLGSIDVLFLLPSKAGKGLYLSPAYLKINKILASFKFLILLLRQNSNRY